MKFNKINIDRAPLSADEINAAMDFDGLINPKVSAAAKSGGGKVIKLGMYTLAAAAVVAASVFFFNQKSESASTAELDVEQAADVADKGADREWSGINPLLQGYEKEYITGTLNAETGGELELGSSSIQIPPSAFVDEKGNPITGEVTLKYREFNDVLDIFLSGIPMEYDSAGVNYTFESNGMFELRGFQQVAPVFIAPDKSVEVKMDIEGIKPGFSEYALDETTGEWIFKNGQNYEVQRAEEVLAEDLFSGKDNVKGSSSLDESISDIRYQPVPKLTAYWDSAGNRVEIVDNINVKAEVENEPEVKAIKKKIAEIVKEKQNKQEPTKPTQANPELPQIQIEVDYADFPELKAFKNTLFQVAESDLDDFNMEWGQETWTDMRINKSTKPGFYRLVFSKPGRRETVNASPVLGEKDMAAALNKYEELFTQYETAVDSLETVKIQKEKELKAARAKAREEARARAAEQVELQKLRRAQLAQQQEDLRKNRVRTLAEQDSLQKEYRDTQMAIADESQKANLKQNFLRQDVSAVFQVNGFGYYNCDKPSYYPQGATVIAEYSNQDDEKVITNVMLVEGGRRALWRYTNDGKLKYNPKEKNLLIGVTSNNKIAVLTPEKFEEVEHRRSRCVIKMKECEKELSSKTEIQEFVKAEGFAI